MATAQPVSVLIAHKNTVLLGIVARFLQAHATHVVAAAHGVEETLAQAKELRPDIVLIDLDATGFGGLEAISRLREAVPEMGIIATNLLDVDGYRQAALGAGADEFVAKPLLRTHLLPAIRRTRRPGPDRSGSTPLGSVERRCGRSRR